MIELQGIWQIGTRLEAIGGDAHFGRQVFHQRLQFTGQLPIEIAAAVGFQVQGFQQVAIDLERQRPRLDARRRQCQFALNFERPVARRLQQAG
ncbi:hypothetical protein D3C81_1965740 [compost metagenome]